MSKWMNALAWIRCGLACGLIAVCCSCSKTSSVPNAGAQPNGAAAPPAPVASSPSSNAATDAAQPADSTEPPKPAFYTVDHYDAARNPADDLAATIERAKTEKKHILIQVGGDWCGWCKLMSHFIETDEKVRDNILGNYVVMKVTENGDQANAGFLSQYPAIHGYPHLFVLDSDGKLLHSQDTADLEEGHGYNEAVYLEFLNQWKPTL